MVKMQNKKQILNQLRQEFVRWETLLAGLDERQITLRQLPADLSIQDVVAHLATWQRRSNTRLQAALQGGEPDLSDWPAGLNPESEEDLDAINAWIHAQNRERTWVEVYAEWRTGYERLMEQAQAIPEEDLMGKGRYPWLAGYALADVLEGWYDHHHEEHLLPLLEWLQSRGMV